MVFRTIELNKCTNLNDIKYHQLLFDENIYRDIYMHSYIKWLSDDEFERFKFNLTKIIGREIRTLRKTHGVSGLELGITINKSQQQVSRYENGSTPIPLDILIILLYIFEIPPEFFFNKILSSLKSDINTKKTLGNISKSSKIHKHSEYWKTLK
ncbi:TPA: helix-turn-helix transcriptional regulator [Morganella morganii subsp. morganii]|nr:helix-turn-helix transcriptional regulator [Morganella morganii subsp. morganii]